MRDKTEVDYAAWGREFRLLWLRSMCDMVGISMPPDEEKCLALIDESTRWIAPRVRAAFPGSIEAIRALRARGHTLHTASGEDSTDLHGYLEGMGVRHLYGPDLVNTPKEGVAYYNRIFADATVVDDSPRAIAWAAHAGATTVFIASADGNDSGASLTISSLAELPATARLLEG